MFLRSLILTVRLFFDRRVPFLAKLLPIAALLYFVSPIDIAPDWLLALGFVDDIAVVLALLQLFMRRAPDEVLADHLARMSQFDRVLGIVRDLPPKPKRDEGRIIDR